jgi:hypothetical protein
MLFLFLQNSGADNISTYIAVLAFLVSVVAVYFSYKTAEHQRLSTSATLLSTFTATFDSPEMCKCRKSFAERLLDENKREQIDLASSERVLELFEEIAYLTRRKVLDKGMVWNHFFWFIERYYHAVTKPTNLIEKARKDQKSNTIYQEIVWLYDELGRFDIKESKVKKYIPPDGEQVEKFLLFECQLDIENNKNTLPIIPTKTINKSKLQT